MILVLLWGCTSNEGIINIIIAEMYASEYLVNEVLKSLGSTLQAEWHVHEFKEAKGGGYCTFGNVSCFHRDLMIAQTRLILKKIVVPHCVDVILNVWNCILIGNSGTVQSLISTTGYNHLGFI